MWLFTRYGFYSVVQARRVIDGRITKGPDALNLMVRARVRQHLVNLQMAVSALDSFEILESADNDYRFRMVIPRRLWLDVAQGLTEDIDYANFKGVCEEEGIVDESYGDALHRVWSIHHQLQESHEA